MTDQEPARRWYDLTPDRFLVGLLALLVFLMLSEHFRWFAFNEKNGLTAVIALGVVCVAVLVLLVWFLKNLILGRRFQFGFRSVFMFMLTISIPLGWLTMEKQRAQRQTRAIEWVRQMGGACGVESGPDGKKDGGLLGLVSLWEPLAADFPTKVVSVHLEGENVADISPIAALRDVRRIVLAKTAVSDLAPLMAMSRLEFVEIYGNSSYDWDQDRRELEPTPVTNVRPLVMNRRLTQLTLDTTAVSDVAPIARMTNLRHLDLTDSPVSDLSPLAGLKSLRSLVLWRSPVSDLSPLAGMTELERLNLQETSVADLSPLAGLTNIKRLRLHNASSVTDIQPLTRMRNMEYLDLSYTSVSDLSPLAGMSSLAKLDLAGTRVTDLSPLAGLTSLKVLNVACLSVDLGPLKGIKQVQIVVGEGGHVIVPKEMEHRVYHSTGDDELEIP